MNITKEELKSMMDHKDDIFLLNILPFEEFKKKRIPTSHNIPVGSDNFKELVLETIENKKQLIIVYAYYESGELRKATNILEDLGYLNVIEFKGGLEEWQERFSLEGSEV